MALRRPRDENGQDDRENVDRDCPYEKILGFKRSGSSQIQYLVKVKDRPYKRAVWVGVDELKEYAKSTAMLSRATRSLATLPTEEPYYDQTFDEIDRIVTTKGKSYLIKWKKLEYDQCTWEKTADSASQSRYKSQAALKYGDVRGDVINIPVIDFEPFEEYRFGKVDLELGQVACLNRMISDFLAGKTSELGDVLNMDLQMATIAFLHILVTEMECLGPFLVVCRNTEFDKYYEVIRTIKQIVTVQYFGSAGSRDVIKKMAFEHNGKVKFHVLLTTPDVFQEDIDVFSQVNWRAMISVNSQRLDQMRSTVSDAKNTSVITAGYSARILHGDRVTAHVPELAKMVNVLLRGKGVDQKSNKQLTALETKLATLVPKQKGGWVTNSRRVETWYVDCPLTAVQKHAVKLILKDEMGSESDRDSMTACQKILRVCTHPFVLFGQESGMPEDVGFVECSMKLMVLDAIAKEAMANGERLMVVSGFSSMLDIIEDWANARQVSFCRIQTGASSEIENGKTNIMLYNPDFCELSKSALDMDVFVCLDRSKMDVIMKELSDSEAENEAKIYVLSCGGCCEVLLRNACAFNNHTDTGLENLCRQAAVHALFDASELTAEEVLSQATQVESEHLIDQTFEDELGDHDFYSLMDDACKVKWVQRESALNREWSVRDRDQLFRNLFRFGWGRWDDIRLASGLAFSVDAISAASRGIIREMVKNGQSTSGHVFGRSLVSEEDETGDGDMQVFDESSVFGDAGFKSMLNKSSALLLKRLETLHYLQKIATVETILTDASSAPASWWNEEHDYGLIQGTYRYGYGNYEHFMLNRNLRELRLFGSRVFGDGTLVLGAWNDRVLALGNIIRKNIDNDKKEAEMAAEQGNREDGGVKFSKDNEGHVFRYLMKMGIDSTATGSRDWDAMLANSGVVNKTADELRLYVEDYLSRCVVAPEDGGVAAQTADRITKRVSAFERLREIVEGQDEDSLIALWLAAPRWRLISDKWTGKLEYYFFREFYKHGFGSTEIKDILKSERFADVFPDNVIPPFVTKAQSIIKRINCLWEFNQKKAKMSKPSQKQNKSAKVQHSDQVATTMADVKRGDFSFPLYVTPTTAIWNLGQIIVDRPKFHSERYVYPAGFKTSKYFTSLLRTTEKSRWFSEIVDTGLDGPVFRVWMEDSPDQVFEGLTPTAPWTAAVKAISKKTKVKMVSVSGPDAFLLASAMTTYLIQNLPGIDELEQYQKRNV